MSGFISQSFATLLIEHCQPLGCSATDLGLPANLPARLPLHRWLGALAAASRKLRDPLLGLTISRLIEPRHFGVVGYVTQQCPTLLEVARQLQRFLPLFNDASPLQHRIDGHELVFYWPGGERHYDRLMEQVVVGVAVHYLRQIATQAVAPLRVRLVQPAEGREARYRVALACPIEFSGPQTEVAYSMAAMLTPVRQPDAALLAVLQRHAEHLLAELPRRDSFLDQLQGALSALVRERNPTLREAARKLEVSERTLQRQLERRGLRFQGVLDDTREMLARDHLRNHSLRIADVAILLGYSEQSAFDRAFRRWTGTTPGEFRRG